ncbi:MAG: PAS domain S-box protein [Chloroflexi bacterium]|nr:PAS domain S-box protein [Chloroflexota bacterium]
MAQQRDDAELFRLLVQSVSDYAIFRLSPQGIIQTWNVGAERLKGYSASEIIGRSFETFYTPEDLADRRPARLLKIARTDGRVEDEGWRVRKDGTRFWADVVITALFDAGEVVGYAKVTRDLTERRRAEEQRSMRLAAERAAERVARLQTVTAALTAVSRPEQAADLLATVGFAAMGATAGAIAFPLHEQDVLQVVSDTEHQAILGEFTQRIRRDDPYTLAEVWRRGEAIFIPSREALAAYPRLRLLASRSPYEAWAAVPLQIEHQLLAIMGVSYAEPHAFDEDERNLMLAIADIAAQAIGRAELFEAERRTRAEAEAAVRAQDEFLSIASHELRTPVAAVKATAQLAQRSMLRGTLDPPRLVRHLEGIRRAADRLASLVDDLLDVSRLRTGRLELRRQCVEIAPLVEEVVERYRVQLEDKPEYTLVLSLPTQPILADVDPSRMEQVLDNFLSNAVKYSPAGGQVSVLMDADAAGFQLTVTDQGIGLPPGHTETIFEPFGRAPNAATQQIPGLGLGLSICRQLVEAHGGRIWARSPGEQRGTTLGLWLPHPRPD